MIYNLLNKIYNKYFYKHRSFINLNLNPNLKQKKVLISYITKQFELNYDNESVSHPNLLEVNIISSFFIKNGFRVDISYCNDSFFIKKHKDRTYDVIFGFGEVYRYFCETNPYAKKIIYSTENAPKIAYQNELDRINNYNFKYKSNIKTQRAFTYFIDEDFKMSDFAIILTNHYNATNFKELISFEKTFLLKTIGLNNSNFNPHRDVSKTKYNFVWIGSRGLIHKGLDLLVEVFNDTPNLNLHILGLSQKERHLLPKIKNNNIFDHGFISIYSSSFIYLMNMSSFCILPSCSEGMATGVLTGMRHGLIPIITRETGIDLDEYGYYISSFNIQEIKSQILEISKIENQKLENQHEIVTKHANENYNLENFEVNFTKVMEEIFAIKLS